MFASELSVCLGSQEVAVTDQSNDFWNFKQCYLSAVIIYFTLGVGYIQ